MAFYWVVSLFGTRVAETILASVHVRAHQQAGHMDASDLIKTLQETLRGWGRPHMGVRRQWPLAGADRLRVGISVRSRNRACRYRRRSEPGAEDWHHVGSNASAGTCSSGGSPGSWPSLR